jgi:hypothetical protein
VRLSILQAEKFKLGLGDLTLNASNIRGSLRNLVFIALKLATERSALGPTIKLTEASIGMSIDIVLDASDTFHEALCFTAVPTIMDVIILSTVFILEVNGIKHNLGFANLLSQLVGSEVIALGILRRRSWGWCASIVTNTATGA